MLKIPFLIWLFRADLYQLSQAILWQQKANSSALKCTDTAKKVVEKRKQVEQKIG